jgi:hypothetical protein
MQAYLIHAYRGNTYLCLAIGGRAFATKAGAQAWIDANADKSSSIRYEIETINIYD